MCAFKSRSLRTLVLTPERIPSFFVPSLSPRPPPLSLDRTRLLSDQDDDGQSPPEVSPRLRPALVVRPPHTSAAAESVDVDVDLTTCAAMSLPHVAKVTTPYGFHAVLAVSPCTQRRESLFHRNRPGTVVEPDTDPSTPLAGPSPHPGPSRPRTSMQPVKTLGLQAMKEIWRPTAALKALSPVAWRTTPK